MEIYHSEDIYTEQHWQTLGQWLHAGFGADTKLILMYLKERKQVYISDSWTGVKIVKTHQSMMTNPKLSKEGTQGLSFENKQDFA